MNHSCLLDEFEKHYADYSYYADKTRHLYRLASSMEPHFLARPSEFGKTILTSALEAVLRGRRDLFKGLWIDGSDYHWTPSPVISLSLGAVFPDNAADLEEILTAKLEQVAKIEELALEKSSPGKALETLIKNMSDKHECKIAVLIDGYDYPIAVKMARPELAKELASVMGDFMGSLRSAEERLGTVLVTGIMRLKNVVAGIKPGGLVDLTLDEDYADVCGFTVEEFGALVIGKKRPEKSTWLREKLDKFIAKEILPQGATTSDILIKIWADFGGYSWDGKTRLMNPYDASFAFNMESFRSFWFKGVGIKSIGELLKDSWQIHEIARSESPLTQAANIVDLDDINPAALFFQAGLLTVDSVDKSRGYSEFRLRLPNPRLEASICEKTLGLQDINKWRAVSRAQGKDLLEALASQDAEGLQRAFYRLIQLNPTLKPKPERGSYQNLLFMALDAADQRFDSVGPMGDEIFFSRLNGENSPALVIKTHYVKDELTVSWPGLRPVLSELSEMEKEERMRKAAEETLAQIEDSKSLLSFTDEPSEIYKCAFVFNHHFKTLAVFEKADNWLLAPKSRYVVK
ncbi:MAG: AAA family ATPase [Deltaproteobacteria bacterium]|jgi:hypothetical protein|nr:AAA family ATPase [Deltaproteobacteria bacterium]